MSVNLKQYSRLRFAHLVTDEGFEFFDVIDYPTLSVQPDDTFYRVRGSDRPDLLAYNFYGDPVLWWVIALANDLELISLELTEGQLLRIPAPRYVLSTLFTLVVQ